jgi:putative Ca2+/H+ antiporter (TMEM165/GDT1 family)
MNWSVLFSTFGVLFIAELGDKTQLAVITQTCKYRCPFPVFLGASLALTMVTALGAAGGQIIGHFIPAEIIRTAAAMGFVIMGALMFREAIRSDTQESECACETDLSDESPQWWNWKAFGSTLTLLFFAELGDKTQLAVLGLASRDGQPWLVFIGGALALIAVTALGVIGGQQLCRLIPEKILIKISAGVFVVMGILMGRGIV